PAPNAPAPAAQPMATSATLNVQVATAAKIYVNGLATTSTGAQRRYVSNGLQNGFSYSYQVRAEIVRDGKTVTETKTVKLKAGENADLNFTFENTENQLAKEPVSTSLTLHVPADAKVFLSGNPTNLTGEVREFTTTKLTSGDAWSDYTVRIELERNGQMLTKE